MQAWALDIGEQYQFQGNEGVKNIAEFQNIGGLINAWLPNIYTLLGLIILVFAIGAGLGIMSSGGDVEKMKRNQKVLLSAVIGFAILFASYWIIQIIQVVTGVPILGSDL